MYNGKSPKLETCEFVDGCLVSWKRKRTLALSGSQHVSVTNLLLLVTFFDRGDDRTAPILNTLTLPGWNLCSLDLAENNLTPAVLPAITNVMNNCRHSLRLLRLSDNPRLLSHEEAKPSDIRNFLRTFRECRKMQSLSIDQCGVDGPLALSVFESCLTHTSSVHHVPLRQICMQNNSAIGQVFWRRIIHEVIPRLATLKTLFVSDFEYETDMQASFAQNMVLEWVEPAWFTRRLGLDHALVNILIRNRLRNRRYSQVKHLLLAGHVTAGIQSAAVRRLVHDGVSGKAALFLILSRCVEASHDASRVVRVPSPSSSRNSSTVSSPVREFVESSARDEGDVAAAATTTTTNEHAIDKSATEPSSKRHRAN